MTSTAFRVPYVTAWTGEMLDHPLAFAPNPEFGGLALTYIDGQPEDRVYGVLRARQGLARGGQPDFKRVNTLCQWRCMDHQLCQVCAKTAGDPDTGRVWWLLTGNNDELTSGYTNAPPTCPACIPQAIAHCPRLRQAAAIYTVGASEPYGVLADTFRPVDGGAELVKRNVTIQFDEFRYLGYALATQMLGRLHDLQRYTLPSVLEQ